MTNSDFSYRLIGTTGCELLDSDGNVIAWTTDELWAVAITALLNNESHFSPASRSARGAGLMQANV